MDYPEIRVDEHESTEMPFRYVKGADGKPVMPEVSAFSLITVLLSGLPTCMQAGYLILEKGMIDLIKKDSEKGFGELL